MFSALLQWLVAPMKSRLMQPPILELESEAGPLWSTIKRQLYRSEVSHVKRLVGEALIKDNRMMWEELDSLRHMLSDFQKQNDRRLAESPHLAPEPPPKPYTPNLHRELLRHQAHVLLQDAKSQAAFHGWKLEELIPALANRELQDFVMGANSMSLPRKSDIGMDPLTPSTQASTRPSSAGGTSACSTVECLVNMPVLQQGRHLGVEELGFVAADIREALQEEQSTLQVAICEQMKLLDAEDARRTLFVGRSTLAMKHNSMGEPSTAQLQALVNALQDLAISQVPCTTSSPVADPHSQSVSLGGAQVRRLKALIKQRRDHVQVAVALPEDLVPEVPEFMVQSNTPAANKSYDPLFDDPFEN